MVTPEATKMVTTEFRQKVLEHYGSACRRCGESNEEILQIDHVNDDGYAQRDTKHPRGGLQFYKWIIANQFPEDLQILCPNCNWAKHKQHERDVKLRSRYDMSETRFQINSGVSPDLYSYIKRQKEIRKCTEKQILQEMYESHTQHKNATHAEFSDLIPWFEERLREIYEAVTSPKKVQESSDFPWLESGQWDAWMEFKARWDAGIRPSQPVPVHRPQPKPRTFFQKLIGR
jgi:hypothetical protein